jgi:hypothetical protein
MQKEEKNFKIVFFSYRDCDSPLHIKILYKLQNFAIIFFAFRLCQERSTFLKNGTWWSF